MEVSMETEPDVTTVSFSALPMEVKVELQHSLSGLPSEKLRDLAEKLEIPEEKYKLYKDNTAITIFLTDLDNLENATVGKLLTAFKQFDLTEASNVIHKNEQVVLAAQQDSLKTPVLIIPASIEQVSNKTQFEFPIRKRKQRRRLEAPKARAHVVHCADAGFTKHVTLLRNMLRRNNIETTKTALRSRELYDGSIWAKINDDTRFEQVDFYLICITPTHFSRLNRLQSVFQHLPNQNTESTQGQNTRASSVSTQPIHNDSADSNTSPKPGNQSNNSTPRRDNVIEEQKKKIIAVLFHGKPQQAQALKIKSLYVACAVRVVKRLFPIVFLAPNDFRSMLYYLNRPDILLSNELSRITKEAEDSPETESGDPDSPESARRSDDASGGNTASETAHPSPMSDLMTAEEVCSDIDNTPDTHQYSPDYGNRNTGSSFMRSFDYMHDIEVFWQQPDFTACLTTA